jgi:NADH:ubiquinone reductase (H+-translocating)
MPKTVVIVGGGFAGVDCARGLERQLPSDWQIVLFNAQNHMTFTPLLAEVVGASISPLHVVWTIRQTLKRTLFHTAEVSALDFAAQEIEYKLVGGRIARQKYDHLVIACGMVVNSNILPGAAARSFPLKTLGDALVLRNYLIGQLERADVEPDPDQRRRLLSFAVLGGGFSGVEAAGEIFDLLTGALRFYRTLSRNDLRVTIIQGGERILPELPAKLGEYAHERLAARGIEIRLKTRAAAVTNAGVALEDGTTIRAGMVVCTIGNATHPLVTASGLPLERGRIRTDGDMRVIGKDNVWGLGDCAVVPNAFDGSPSPTLAQFAIRQARQLARNITLRIAGRPTRPFNFRILGLFAAIGHRNAVGQVLGFTFAGFFAWAMWRGIYLSKMPTLARKVQVAFDWTWDLFFSRDICEISPRETLRIPQSHFEPGEEVFRPGEPGERFYVIEKGTAGIFGAGERGPVLQLGPGEFFSESELARNDGRSYHVRAQEPLDVLTVEYRPFQDFLRHLRTLRTGSNDRIARIDSLNELRSVVRNHPGLAHAKVSDAMTSPPPTLPLTSSFASAISHFQQEKRTAFAVVDDGGRLQGVCTVTDLHNALCSLRSLQTPVSEIMVRPVVTVGAAEPLSKAFNIFLLEPVKRLVVVADKEPTRPVGLLTLFDIVVHYASHEGESDRAEAKG